MDRNKTSAFVGVKLLIFEMVKFCLTEWNGVSNVVHCAYIGRWWLVSRTLDSVKLYGSRTEGLSLDNSRAKWLGNWAGLFLVSKSLLMMACCSFWLKVLKSRGE